MAKGDPWITSLATDDENIDGWDIEDTGMPGVATFSDAIQVWSAAQNRPVTVQEAAVAFNVAPEIIRQAVEYHYWMFIGPGDVIEHEGE